MPTVSSYPHLLINMLMAAEASGSLDQTLERLADSFEKDAVLKEKIKSALAYPLLVTVGSPTLCNCSSGLCCPRFCGCF